MTSTPNDSFNTSDHLMDLSVKTFWVIVHYPYSDPECEYEIVSKKDVVFDSWEVLERGAEVTVKYGNAKVQGNVVAVSGKSGLIFTLTVFCSCVHNMFIVITFLVE